MPSFTVNVFIDETWSKAFPYVVADNAAEAEFAVLDMLNIDVVAEEND